MKFHIAALLCAGCSLAACASVSSQAQAVDTEKFRPIQADDGLLLYFGGKQTWLVDPKDRELSSALGHVEARIAELPAELDRTDIRVEALSFALDVLACPWTLRASLSDAAGAPIPIQAQLSVAGSADAPPHALAERFQQLLTQHGAPALGKSEAMHNMQMIPLGPVSAYHGVPTATTGPALAEQFVIAVNGVRTDPVELGTLDLPEDVEPFVAFRFDYGQYARAIGMVQAMAGGGDHVGVNPMMMMGMEGVVAQGGAGHGTDRSYGATRSIGYVPAARASGMLADGPLSESHIMLIPADATWAMVARANPAGVLSAVRAALAQQSAAMGLPEGTDALDMLAQMTDFDVEADLVDHLGQTFGAYTSFGTGGGGLLSGVAFFEVEDEKHMRETLDWAEAELNELATEHAKGYVKLQSWSHGGRELATLTFPGLPVPIEVSYALADGWFFLALSPQGLIRALEQAHEPESSLLDNEQFDAMRSMDLDELVSLQFFDAPRLVREGYSAVNLACAALSNAARSPQAPERGPVQILPAYEDLMRDAKAFVAQGRLVGDDMLVLWQADRSLLVNACGVAGMFGGVQTIGAIAAIAGAAEDTQKAKLEAQAMRAELEVERARRAALEAEAEAQRHAIEALDAQRTAPPPPADEDPK
jgi:hypothetical protein